MNGRVRCCAGQVVFHSESIHWILTVSGSTVNAQNQKRAFYFCHHRFSGYGKSVKEVYQSKAGQVLRHTHEHLAMFSGVAMDTWPILSHIHGHLAIFSGIPIDTWPILRHSYGHLAMFLGIPINTWPILKHTNGHLAMFSGIPMDTWSRS